MHDHVAKILVKIEEDNKALEMRLMKTERTYEELSTTYQDVSIFVYMCIMTSHCVG